MSKSATATRSAEPQPAATVLVLRDGDSGLEVFMLRRHTALAFMGGAHVFPGGRVDAGDLDASDERWCDGTRPAAAQLADLTRREALAFHVAAIRELFEEAGVLLARDSSHQFASLAAATAHARFTAYRAEVHAGRLALRDLIERENLRLALDALVAFAHWVTPPFEARRFDTRFFVTPVPAGQTPAHDDREATDGDWTTPAGALERCRRGEIVLPPPTWTTLRELEPFRTVREATAWARRRRITRRQPLFIERGGRTMLLLPGDPLNPEQAVDEVSYETRFVHVAGQWRAEPRKREDEPPVNRK